MMNAQSAPFENQRSASSSPPSSNFQLLHPLPLPITTSPARFVSLVHSSRSLLHFKQIHAHLLRLHLLSGSSPAAAAIIAAPPPLRCIPYILSLFHHLPSPLPSPHLFNALIRALSDSSLHSAALSYLTLMLSSGLQPGRLSLPFALRSAAALRSSESAATLHSAAAKSCLDLDPFVRTSLADAYGKLGSHQLALKVFDETPQWHLASNILIWNVAITVCCRSGHIDKARNLFAQMPERNLASWNSMINGFMKAGDLESAVNLFEKMPEQNVVSWTTMLSGFSQNDDNESALAMFETMLESGMKPNNFTVSAALSSCAKLGALNIGFRIHDYLKTNGFLEDGPIGTALVDMYSKCGKVELASHVFNRMKKRDVETWTAMIMGWAVHGCWSEAVRCFEDMNCSCIEPDEGAFLAILMACSHAGKIDKGLDFFDSMKSSYQIEPGVKHYTCIVDMYGRAGMVNEALEFLNSMPIEPDYVLWGALLSASRANKNVEIAELAAEKLLKIKPLHAGSQVFVSNMYAGAGMWDSVEKVRSGMKEKSVSKVPGWSYIEVKGKRCHFYAGDQSHSSWSEIFTKLEELVDRAKKEGYEPDMEWVLHDIEEEDKRGSLGCHSEKLALAFGLMKLGEEEGIRIVKNLRVCGDCHSLMKFTSRIYGKEIMLRDNKRFHRFRVGECSCGDYW
ncbi:pentatricopeptide repeat-containing protein At1g04840 [Phalaenopsis equestris]|uniref:pentatricopeptide repeat-containing protein At1g04840 n=1 Tax=Phalaenopsis equestris TaxID=78828 RepID=UPI0009E39031|nr:pentatricopeptide repeat-containing protein At1g04840 [Phalaenopsis equestris]